MSDPSTQQDPPSRQGRGKGPIIAIVGCACLLVLALALVAVIGGVFALRDSSDEETPGAPSPANASEAPPNTSAETPALLFGEEGQGTTVDIYLDYSCSHCADFAATNDEDLQELAESGEANIRIHPLPMLNGTSAGYSERAASAATCVNAEEPELFWEFSTVLFDHQADGPSLDSADIADLAAEVGAGGGTLACIEGEVYLEWINETVYPEAQSQITGTPGIFLDGELWGGDWSVSGELAGAITGS